MESFLVGLFTLVIGLALAFAGYRLFRVIIPLWGLFAGFSWTAQVMALGLGTGFLATLFSWIIALIVGLVFAAFAYLFYEFTVAVLAGFVGYWLVGGFFLAIGFAPGFFVTLLASIAGIALGAAAIYFRAPKGLLIALSAVGGAITAIAGLLIMFGQLPIGVLGTGLVNEIIRLSVGWSLIGIALAAVGIYSQLTLSRGVMVEEVTYSSGNSDMLAGTKGGATRKPPETDAPKKRE